MAAFKKKLSVMGIVFLLLSSLFVWRIQEELFQVTASSRSAITTLPLVPELQLSNWRQTDSVPALAIPERQATATEAQCLNSCSKESLQVVNSTKLCMQAAHMDLVDGSLLSQAKTNARYLYDEFRKVIPHDSLRNLQSHCWKESFSIQWDKSQYSGHIGNISLHKEFEFNRRFNGLRLSSVTKTLSQRNYHSDTVCLPNLFLAGFPKCGSTFFYCFVNKLVSQTLYGSLVRTTNVVKEPHFWALANAANVNRVPIVDDIGIYFLNFLPGVRLLTEFEKPTAVLVDGTPNTMFNWPRFRKSEHDLTNYCILPSVVPNLLPNSKYAVIVRNPITMLYSAFWFSCTGMGFNLSTEQKLKGPDLFHERIVNKLDMFNDCMKDSSTPFTSIACKLEDKHTYASCIQQRLHLLDKCTHEITFNLYSPELSKCGRSRVAMGMYYVHIRKWLSVLPRDRLLVITLEELTRDYNQAAHKVLTFLDLDTSVASSDSTISHITHSCYENSQSSVDYKHDPKLRMRNDTLTLLEHFYFPFNSMLAELVGIDLGTLW